MFYYIEFKQVNKIKKSHYINFKGKKIKIFFFIQCLGKKVCFVFARNNNQYFKYFKNKNFDIEI
jgi:hypothetical protein